MSQRSLQDFQYYADLYSEGKFYELTSSEDGLFFLTLRSLARKENLLYLCEKAGVQTIELKSKDILPTLFLSTISIELLQQSIKELYVVERAQRKVTEKKLLAELFKLRVFDWGGIHQNDINKHLVDNYVKKVTDYDELVNKVETEIIYSLKGFVLCSWYNNWTSIIIEDIFKDHPRVLPTVGKVKQVDFFIDGIPFDLKVTYFPATFLEKQRQARKLVKSEISELKKACRKFNIPVDSNRSSEELKLDMIAALTESSNPDVKAYFSEFLANRREIISETIVHPRTLLKWLYENQGTQRFDASNRLFLIVINQDALEDSWKLKRDYQLLKQEITSYLDTRSFSQKNLLLEWSVNGKKYHSYSDVLFILK